VPLDPAYPADRLAFMLEDSGGRVLLTPPSLAGRLPPDEGRELVLDPTGGGRSVGGIEPAQATGSVGAWEGGAHTKEPSRVDPVHGPGGGAGSGAFAAVTH